MNESIERCTTCVLPHSERIEFDEHNVCQLCRAAEAHHVTEVDSQHDEAALLAQLELIKQRGQGRSFDAVVGVSGGRDSSYMLYLLVRRHGLRCVAAYHRTPFTPVEIDNNVRRLTTYLDVPLVEMDLSAEKHRRFTTKIVQLWLRKPDPLITNFSCAPCKLHNSYVYKIAREYDVPAIVFGSNKYESFHLIPGSSAQSDAEAARGMVVSLRGQIRRMFSLMGRGLQACWNYPELLGYVPVGMRTLLNVSQRTPYLRLRYRDILSVDYFHHARYDEAERDQVLAEMGWQLPPHCNTSWRADCTFADLKNYMYWRMTGVTYTDAFFANMVRHGTLSRDQALARLAIEGQLSPARVEQACHVMGISSDLFPFAS